MSNQRTGCTVIYDEREIFYNVGVRLKAASTAGPSRCAWASM